MDPVDPIHPHVCIGPLWPEVDLLHFQPDTSWAAHKADPGNVWLTHHEVIQTPAIKDCKAITIQQYIARSNELNNLVIKLDAFFKMTFTKDITELNLVI